LATEISKLLQEENRFKSAQLPSSRLSTFSTRPSIWGLLASPSMTIRIKFPRVISIFDDVIVFIAFSFAYRKISAIKYKGLILQSTPRFFSLFRAPLMGYRTLQMQSYIIVRGI
jgi:hypothetical protein